MAATITEAAFTSQVIELAKLFNWRVAHFRPAMNRRGKWSTPVQADGAGFPDLVMLKGGRLLFVELKVGRNKASAAQSAWLDALSDLVKLTDHRTGVEVHLWYSAQWDEIERTIKGEL